MAIGDRFGDMAEKATDKAGGAGKVSEHIGRAAGKADSATGGRHRKAVEKGEVAARSAVGKAAKKNKSKRRSS